MLKLILFCAVAATVGSDTDCIGGLRCSGSDLQCSGRPRHCGSGSADRINDDDDDDDHNGVKCIK